MADAAQMEQVIRLVPGVLAARVVLASTGEVEEVHVLSGASRSAKRLVRDIESCFLAHFGQQVDYRRISVAEVAEEPPEQGRLSVESINLKIHARGADAKVDLHWGKHTVSGAASGPFTERQRLLLLGRATVEAVAQTLPEAFTLYLLDLDLFPIQSRRAAVAIVGLVSARREEILCGTAYVKRDEGEAAVRATLAALNRRLEPLLEDVLGGSVNKT